MIDLSGMKDIRVDQDRRSVQVRPGCTLGDVDHEAQRLGLVVPAGIVSETGIAGLTLGGGFGWLTRKYGYTSDNLLSADVVLADGRLVRASPTEHEDLFWGICGGGGNFGVVTSFEYQAYPLSPLVMAGLVVHSFDDAASVIRFFREFTEGAPDEVCCLLLLRPAPPAPFLPTEVHGRMIAGIAACYVGTVEDGERALRPVMQFGNPIGHNLAPKPFISFQKMFDAGQPNGRQYYWRSEYMSELSPAMDETLIKQAGRIASPHSAILLFQLGGAMGRIDEERFAAGHRDANYIVNIAGAWDDPEESESHVAWVRDSWTDVTPFSTGGTYVNFLTGEEGEDRVRAAYGKNYDRLVEVKSKYDPDNLFKVNQNIRPGG
jgi:FAD/FMN-containing dehydrogenase